MKKIIALTLITGMIFTGCSTNNSSSVDTSAKTPTDKTETVAVTEIESTTTESPSSTFGSNEELKALGDVEVDKGLLTVEFVMPAKYMEGLTQDELDLTCQENDFISATLNEDGSVTYVMTKEAHSKYVESFKEEIATTLNAMVGSTDYPNITSIKTNDNLTEFNVTTTSTELSLNESFSVIAYYVYGGMYNIFSGTKVDNITVNFINANSGKIINTANSSEME